jgi:hypothetical protein
MNINDLKKIIRESYLREIGDLKNIHSYNFTQISPNKWEFNTDFGRVEVYFSIFDPKDWGGFEVKHNDYNYSQTIYNVTYSIDDVTSQIQKTNYKELLKIINTVVKIINIFIKQNSPYSLILAGEDKKGTGTSDKQKNTLYITIASQHLLPGYRISKTKITDPGFEIDGYILFKDK